MNGIVMCINWTRGMVGVHTEEEGFSIIELLSDDFIEIGDTLQWDDFNPLGGETVKNITKDAAMDVFFQNHCVNIKQLKQQLMIQHGHKISFAKELAPVFGQ